MLEILLCVVVGVTDGDSLTVRCDVPDGRVTLHVRLAEIDAPERRQPFGEKSKLNLSALCFEKEAVVRPKTRDRYGRTVARVECNGVDASAAQVRSGLAWAFTKYLTDPRIGQDEAEARVHGAGLWSDTSPVEPWRWRRGR